MESRFEDHGADRLTVRELDAGKFEYHGPSTDNERRILSLPFRYSQSGDRCVFDFV